MKLHLSLDFKTKFGENLQVSLLEKDFPAKVYPLRYDKDGQWSVEIDYFSKQISYTYQLVNSTGEILDREYSVHHLSFPHTYNEFAVSDVWNLKNFPENYLNNKILKNTLSDFNPRKVQVLKKHTHLFRLEAPLYQKNWIIVLLGSDQSMGSWQYESAVEMTQTDYGVWECALTLKGHSKAEYKYGLKDLASGEILSLEYGGNRKVAAESEAQILQIQADHFFRFQATEMYHAAGVAVPVFSLRTANGFGVGEFLDLKQLADWAKTAKLSLLQILPVNDTTANYSWTDSYPYAAISVYALHPQYLTLDKLQYALPDEIKSRFQADKISLNALGLIDYEQVMAKKWFYLKAIFHANTAEILKDRGFRRFLKETEGWLLPYAAFCVLRDKYGTPNFTQWKTHKKYIAGKVATLFNPKNKEYGTAMLHAWVQYELHLQLKEAVAYAHSLGISLKGDLPIGIYRYSVEAWTEPELFGMDFQAGAPPDQFTDLGQNWEFPTYNWEAMKRDGYRWWKNRFKTLEQYFDAMRIDHILGFFRIWRMPLSATQGILGYFYPAVPVTVEEFSARQISFDKKRFCEPFINEATLWNFFGEQKHSISENFMFTHGDGTYTLKEQFNTQRKLTEYFRMQPHGWVEERLISLCANVLFLEEEKDDGTVVFHPRFNVHKTDSYQNLPADQKGKIYDLYVDYFFRRQDELWYQSAMEKLPVILNATDMLICGEDLGLVPAAVPLVMDRLAITALKVQRMPADNSAWYDPRNADYMNVVTASSHDSSTLRQWWQEDRAVTQHYFNAQLGQHGTAPWDLQPQIAEIIMKQHLYNNAMLAIFPIQEFFATEENLRRENMEEERINNPAVFPHHWRYRMHLTLEELQKNSQFSAKIAAWVSDSGRI